MNAQTNNRTPIEKLFDIAAFRCEQAQCRLEETHTAWQQGRANDYELSDADFKAQVAHRLLNEVWEMLRNELKSY
jgi:hypothetical protein